MSQELKITPQDISPIEEQVMHLQVNTSESLVKATEYLSQANKYLDALTIEKEKLTKPINATLKEIRARYKPLEEALESIIGSLRSKMSQYQSNLVKSQQEKESKITANVESGYIKTDTAISKLEALGEVDTSVLTDHGSVQFREVRKFEVVDMSLLPIEFHIADEVAIRNEMKKGTELPGVRYFSEQVPYNTR